MKRLIKKALKVIFAKRPIQTTAHIVQLAPSELLKGRCALITGGTSGIGFSIAQAFLNAGAKVVITGRSESRIESALAKLNQPEMACGFVLDNSCVSLFDATLQKITGGG